MAARVSQVVGQKENPANFLLMHAMGPNVAGVIGSAETPAEPISGLTFLPVTLHIMLPPIRPPAVEMPKATRCV